MYRVESQNCCSSRVVVMWADVLTNGKRRRFVESGSCVAQRWLYHKVQQMRFYKKLNSLSGFISFSLSSSFPEDDIV